MRVAVIDIGSNSTRTLVAEIGSGPVGTTIDEVARHSRVTRLARGLETSGGLATEAIDEVSEVVGDYLAMVRELGAERTVAIATSAVRDADNGEAFLGEVEWSYGFVTRLLSGDEEAALTLRGIGAVEAGTLVVDIGGGSTELQVVGTGLRRSLDVGCVRMTERFGEDVQAIRAHVGGLLPELETTRAIGVAGTVTTIAALDLKLSEYDPERIHGHVISRRAVDEQTMRLRGLSLAERAKIVEPGRAPVIVAGAAILAEIVDRYELYGIRASERDILHGAALAAAELPEPEEGAAPPGAYSCC